MNRAHKKSTVKFLQGTQNFLERTAQMFSRKNQPSLVACLLIWAAAAYPFGLQAQGGNGSGAASSPVNARGTSVSSSFQFGDVDSVNLFNGNLSLRLPIGPTYPAGGSLSHGLTLAYNSNIWDWVEACEVPMGMGGEPGPLYYQAPDPLSNAGLGWTLNPGMVLAESNVDPPSPGRTTYFSPDGGRHEFYPTLHPNVGAASGVEYTRDGSYLRLRSFPAQCHSPSGSPPSSSCVLKLDFPNGNVHTFTYQPDEQLPVPFEKPWRVTEIRDPFGNTVNYEYLPPDGAGEIVWKVSDSFRFGNDAPVVVTFEPSPVDNDEESHRIRSVRFLTFGGEEATYEFAYQELPIDRRRPTVNPSTYTCTGFEDTVVLSQLTEVRLPGVPSSQVPNPAPLWINTMEYYLEASDPGSVISKPGAIRRLQLPTGGGFEWQYSHYTHGSEGGKPWERTFRPAFGVKRKALLADMGTAVETEVGVWTYEPMPLTARPPESPWDEEQIVNSPNNGGNSPCYFATTVTDPEENFNIHYFNTARLGFEKEFGQPYTVCSPGKSVFVGTAEVGVLFDVDNDGTSDTAIDPISIISGGEFTSPPGDFERPELARRRYLSSRSFDSSGNLLRENWVDYEYDEFFPSPDTPSSLRDKISYNPRLRRQETSFCDDPVGEVVDLTLCSREDYPRYTRSTFSDFDGLGNFRASVNESTFGGEADQKVFTGFNPQGNSPPSAGSPWLLNLYDRRVIAQVSEPDDQTSSDATTSLACFNSQTGFLEGTRTLSANTWTEGTPMQVSSDDLLTRYTASPRGHVKQVDSYGGDGSGLNTGIGCHHPGGTPQYRLSHTYELGALATSDFLFPGSTNPQTGSILNVANNTIDPWTGVVAKSTDAAGVETSFFFDQLGRHNRTCVPDARVVIKEYKIGEQPEADGPFESSMVTWTAWNEGGCIQGKGGLEAGDSTTWDSLGRKILEHRKTPTGPTAQDWDWAERGYTYNALGWPLEVSVWAAPFGSDTAAKTLYSDYDSFGRAGKVTSPDGSVVTTSYRGNRFKETRVGVLTASGTRTRLERQFLDGLGRLYKNEEFDAGSTTVPLLRTAYRYDEGGRVNTVCVNDDDDSNLSCEGAGQGREFEYDGRGLLVAESHPEIGVSSGGGGSHTFRYDALGNLVEKHAPDSSFSLRYAYDSASRVTQVRELATNRLLKEFFYARENLGDNLLKGKLFQAKRRNWVRRTAGSATETEVVVTETFGYTDPIGRRTNYAVRTNDGPNFNSSVELYDYADNVAYLTYPYCDTGSCNGPLRQVISHFRFGFHTRTDNWAPIIEYHFNGELKRLKHWNNTHEFRVLDAHDWRLGSILVNNNAAQPLWNTESYSYDPAGNITGIGSDSYRYDLFGRLTSGTVNVDGVSTTQGATYDLFGNLTSLNNSGHSSITGPSPGPIGVSSASNRLTPTQTFPYDGNGNLEGLTLGATDLVMEYDALDRMTYLSDGTVEKSYLYTAGDERLAILGLNPQDEAWTPRAANNQVLRRYKKVGEDLFWDRDYMYTGSRPIGSVNAAGEVRHFHADHLGTIRRITDANQQIVEERDYYPFGGAIQMLDTATEPLQFTGHERDIINGEEEAQLDYMHARYYTPHLGRFASVDPVSGSVGESQSWNRYTYVRNNPIRSLDPDGRLTLEFQASAIVALPFLPGGVTVAAGIAFDDRGNVGLFASGGSAFGADAAAGGDVTISGADTIFDRAGGSVGFAIDLPTGPGGGVSISTAKKDEPLSLEDVAVTAGLSAGPGGVAVSHTQTGVVGFNVPSTLRAAEDAARSAGEAANSTSRRVVEGAVSAYQDLLTFFRKLSQLAPDEEDLPNAK
ncbi:MAG: hypothetical protein K0U98_00345 [Deltaproteobacteria bacterium]|nr:hypothetical protein [Deltaproteobacteria bacterium]